MLTWGNFTWQRTWEVWSSDFSGNVRMVVMFLLYSTERLSESTKRINFPQNYWVPEEIVYPLQHFSFKKGKKKLKKLSRSFQHICSDINFWEIQQVVNAALHIAINAEQKHICRNTKSKMQNNLTTLHLALPETQPLHANRATSFQRTET